jgi:ABC-type sugar transport system substrate-binding protein
MSDHERRAHPRGPRSARHLRAVLALVAALALALAACGGDDEGSGGGEAQSGGTAAQAEVSAPKPITTPPDKIPIAEFPWDAAPPKGKTIIFLQCEVPICEKIAKGMREATAAMGWKLQVQTFKNAAPGAGLQSAIQRKPDAIAITGIPEAVLKPQLAAAAKAKIPVVSCSHPGQPSPTGYAAICSTTTAPDGEQLALWAIQDSGGKAKVATVTISSYPILKTATDATANTLKKYCPDECSHDVIDVTVDDLGAGQVPSKIVAYVQSHQDINYISFSFADLETGVPEALKRSGFGDKVKLMGNGAGPAQFQALVKGGGADKAWVAYPAVYQAWVMLDAAARMIADGKIPDGYQKQIDHNPTYIVDNPDAAKALAPSYDWEGPTNYKEQFTELWKVGA